MSVKNINFHKWSNCMSHFCLFVGLCACFSIITELFSYAWTNYVSWVSRLNTLLNILFMDIIIKVFRILFVARSRNTTSLFYTSSRYTSLYYTSLFYTSPFHTSVFYTSLLYMSLFFQPMCCTGQQVTWII